MPSGPTPSTTTVSSNRNDSLGTAENCFARSNPTVTAMTSVSTATSSGRSSGTRTRKLPGTTYRYSDQPPNRCGGSAAVMLFP